MSTLQQKIKIMASSQIPNNVSNKGKSLIPLHLRILRCFLLHLLWQNFAKTFSKNSDLHP